MKVLNEMTEERLQKLEEIYQELIDESLEGSQYAQKHRACAFNVLELIEEVKRLRGNK